jgi:hypothetical protein
VFFHDDVQPGLYNVSYGQIGTANLNVQISLSWDLTEYSHAFLMLLNYYSHFLGCSSV